MSNQTTLFSAWGASKSTGPKPQPQDHPPPTDPFDQFEDDLTEADLEELCKVEEQVSTPTATGGSFHVGPSHALLNSSIIEAGIPGFDEDAGQLWIYPTNYPLRDYQYNIVHKALFTNTLVCLPTGLGKTFIAAVVMYNFYRWYPNGKIVFLAPTKPLVTQQIEACHSIVGIPQSHTAEMTGQLAPKTRVSLWRDKRVFFLTPQVMQNDLAKGTCPAIDVCCLVFDEAHKALGNHAYCHVVKELSASRVRFRVLALSATPGNDLKAVQQVVSNLQIGHIELRSEESVDTQRYVNERSVDKIVVSLEGEILELKRSFAEILSCVLGRLVRYGVFYQASPDRIAKFQLLQGREKFRAAGTPSGATAGTVEGDFALAISLYHAYELLLQHGMRSFYQYLANTFIAGGGFQSRSKRDIIRSSQFRTTMDTLKDRVTASKTPPTNGPSFLRRDGSGKVESGRGFFYSHPKLNRLEEVVLEHFRQCQSDPDLRTRVMIFSQYRESVEEIAEMLTLHAPLIKVMTFVGHASGKSSSKGLSQRQQTEVVRRFREGGYNTLVATCVGEEGLDIGDVDLIVCFDAPKSPIRLVQRMGRTGRKRKGRIVMILAEGKEDQGYNKSQSNKKSIHRAITNGCKTLTFYHLCHRMVPKHIHPEVHKLHLSVGEFVRSKSDIATTKAKSISNQGSSVKIRSNGKKLKKGTYLSSKELSCWSEGLSLTDREFTAVKKSVKSCFTPSPLLSLSRPHPSNQGHNASLNTSRTTATFTLGLDKWIDHQTSQMSHKIVGPSSASQKFVSILEFSDLLRTNEDMGHSYDMEMEGYLNRDDIKTSSTKITTTSERHSSSPNDSPPPVTKRRKKHQRIIDSDNEDEDFKTGHKHGTTLEGQPSSDKSLSKSNISKSNAFTCEETSTVSGEQPHDPSPSTSRVSLTVSGHVVPTAPTEDDLDWIDELEPSQIITSANNSVKMCSYFDAESSSMYFNEEDFDFDTPRFVPSTSKKLPPRKCSTPASLFKAPSSAVRKTPLSSKKKGDLFGNLSARAIFDDFSSSCLEDDQDTKPGTEQGHDVIVLSDSDSGDVQMIEESDFEEQLETEITSNEKANSVPRSPSTPPNTHLNADTSNEDSFLNMVRKCRKRPMNTRHAFFQSPDTVSPGNKRNQPAAVSNTTPVNSRCKKKQKVMFDCESSEDEFDMRNRKQSKWRTTKNEVATKDGASDFVEEEAEVSDDGRPHNTDSEQLSDDYDWEDSFINDNSMLTQLSPSQRTVRTPKKKAKITKSEANSNNLYLRSLMSPEDHMFSGSRRGCGSKYRMVFSQRHELLNHYINKAGFKVHKSREKQSGNRTFVDDDLFEADDSGSEAEEVYGCVEDGEMEGPTETSDEAEGGGRRLRAALLSDDSEPLFGEELSSCVGRSEVEGCTGDGSGEVVISPSLLATVKVGPTAACYSLGMDDWIDWKKFTD